MMHALPSSVFGKSSVLGLELLKATGLRGQGGESQTSAQVDQPQIEILELQLGQRVIEGRGDVLRAVLRVPELL